MLLLGHAMQQRVKDGSSKNFPMQQRVKDGSYERRAYESVDKRVYLRLCPEKRRKKEFGP